jgi:hypothetical protein
MLVTHPLALNVTPWCVAEVQPPWCDTHMVWCCPCIAARSLQNLNAFGDVSARSEEEVSSSGLLDLKLGARFKAVTWEMVGAEDSILKSVNDSREFMLQVSSSCCREPHVLSSSW